ncbi:hypothetical protein CL654_01345 [bacterium]|nr:hypothetical protein [bacterium]|tara:strand:+ start:12102 stop:12938 length:837 start_codon:yes stop_codon:yes gene_type:complete
MKVIKDTGEEENFSKDKFCSSLRDAGAPEKLVGTVCSTVEKELEPGVTTSEIFRRASQYLVKENLYVAGRYNLKKGMRELGPAGFLFEQFLEVILKSMGYTTKRNVMMEGECVPHEIDVIAKKDGNHYLIEAKYHNMRGAKIHIDTTMYADARLEDIYRLQEVKEREQATHSMWLITNTKFTSKAITYGKCRGIKMTGWDYPGKDSLAKIISEHVLYPVTVLPSIDKDSLQKLAKFNMMLAQDIVPHSAQELIKQYEINEAIAGNIVKEASALVYGDK